MKIKLYPCFEHWTKFNNIWLYSDPHFSDPEMKHLRKNYIGDEEQIKKINSKVGKRDLLIILGDIGEISQVQKLKGYKVLIIGNHDVGASKYQKRVVDGRGNNLFDEVYEGPIMINEKILLSHEPIDLSFVLNLHGHDHGNKHGKDKNHINFCAEHIDYTPVSLKQITENGGLSKIESIHRQTINEATKRKEKRLKKD